MDGRVDTMPPAVVPLERLEDSADRLRTQLDKLLDAARDQYRLIQDAEAEASDSGDMGSVFARRYTARDELLSIDRQLLRAHAMLIPRGDPREAAARHVIRDLDQLDERRAA